MMPALLRAQWSRAQRVRAVIRRAPFDQSSVEGRSQERYRRIAINTISSLGSRAVGAAVSLISVPLTLNYLGKAEYGLWAAITTFTTWIAVFDFGVVNGLVNAIAEANGRDDRAAAASYLATAIALLIGIAAVAGVAIAVALPLVPWDRALSARGTVSPSVARWSVAAALVPFLVALPLSVVRQVYAGYQKSYVVNLFGAAASLIAFAAMVAAVRLDLGLPALVAVAGAGGVLAGTAGLVYLIRVEMPWLRPRLAAVSRTAVRRLLGASVPLFLFQLGALFVNETQVLILAHRSGLATVADYSIVMRLYVLVVSFITLGTGSFVPSFREAFERGDRAWLRNGFRRMLALRVLAAAAAGAILLLFGNAMLRAWLGGASVQYDAPVWVAAAVLLLVATWVTAYADLLTVMDRIWPQVAVVLANGAVTSLLTYALSPRLGVLGALIALAAVSVLFASWLLPLLARGTLRAA